MYTISTGSFDPAYNLALEQAVFERLTGEETAFWLWRNDNAVILGRHQDAAREVDLDAARALGTAVVRRPSGGGAVYHDLGNVNYTILTPLPPGQAPDFGLLTRPVRAALESLGASCELSGRNDLTLAGAKISGTALWRQGDRVLLHGTLLFDSDLSRLDRLLTPSALKRKSRAVSSVSARVTNIRPHLPQPLPVEGFIRALEEWISTLYHPETLTLDGPLRARIAQLREERYDNPAWNIGSSPAFALRREGRFPGGTLCAYLDAEAGILREVCLLGDFFTLQPTQVLERALRGVRLERGALENALSGLDAGQVILGLDNRVFVDLLLEEGGE